MYYEYMNYWIGVIGTKQTQVRFQEGNELWFCLPRKASIGDEILLYQTKKVAKAMQGIFASYTVVRLDPEKQTLCKKYGIHEGALVYVDLLVRNKFRNTITLDMLKNNDQLKMMSFVRRNAQATSFNISESEYQTILEMGTR